MQNLEPLESHYDMRQCPVFDWGLADAVGMRETKPKIERICLLGKAAIDGEQLNFSFPSKGFQLLALLAVSDNRSKGRKEIASLLWSSAPDALALTNLRQLLARIRKLFGDESKELLRIGQTEVSLGPGHHRIDVCEFLSLCKDKSKSAAARAFALYQGELLQGSQFGAEDEFSGWLSHARAVLRDQFLFVATSLLMELTRLGRAPKDELDSIARQMLAVGSESEATYRTLIEAYARNGMTSVAKQTYESLARMLRDEYGVAPDSETEAVARRVFFSPRVETDIADVPTKTDWHPRVAFLLPEWVSGTGQSVLLKALISDVANELARYRSFVVLGPHTSFQVDHEFGIPQSNDILRADYTISGFCRGEDSGDVLSLRLAKCDTGEIVWSAEFAFRHADLLQSSRLLSARVSSSLATALEKDMLDGAGGKDSVGAYFHFLEGLGQMSFCDLPHLRRARKSFQASIGADSDYASAHAGLARSLLLEWLMRGADVPDLVVSARKHATLAVQLDPNDARALCVAATIDMYQHELEDGLRKYIEAESLSPNSGDLLVEHANALACSGEAAVGLEKFERAIWLNPMPPDDYWWAGASIAFNADELDTAIQYCSNMQNDEAVLRVMTASYALSGDLEKAKECGRRLRESYPGQTAIDMVGITPDRDRSVTERFLEGLRIAGIE
ncbi:MAG: BTAD domain-containing putative transcriptional regulator [Pseudomonadota bacterium]